MFFVLSFGGANQSVQAAEAERLRTALGIPADKPTPTAPPAQTALEKARVRTFVSAVETDRNGRVVSSIADNPEPTLVAGTNPRGWRVYAFRGFGVMIDPATSLVVGFGGRADKSPERPKRLGTDADGRRRLMVAPREGSDLEARDTAARAYAATGRPHGIYVSFVDDGTPGFFPNLSLGFQPTYRDVPFSDRYANFMQIDRETGELDSLTIFREPPAPPANVVPGVSAADAHLVALQAAARAGVAVSDYPVPYNLLSISVLDAKPNRDSTYGFTSTDRDDAAASRSRLVYDVRVEGRGGKYTALVDAHDGHLLQVTRMELAILSRMPKSAFAPLSGPRPWRVARGDVPWGRP